MIVKIVRKTSISCKTEYESIYIHRKIIPHPLAVPCSHYHILGGSIILESMQRLYNIFLMRQDKIQTTSYSRITFKVLLGVFRRGRSLSNSWQSKTTPSLRPQFKPASSCQLPNKSSNATGRPKPSTSERRRGSSHLDHPEKQTDGFLRQNQSLRILFRASGNLTKQLLLTPQPNSPQPAQCGTRSFPYCSGPFSSLQISCFITFDDFELLQKLPLV